MVHVPVASVVHEPPNVRFEAMRVTVTVAPSTAASLSSCTITVTSGVQRPPASTETPSRSPMCIVLPSPVELSTVTEMESDAV